jgi:hypothetical protein
MTALRLYALSWALLLTIAASASAGAFVMHAADTKAALAAVSAWGGCRQP